MLIDFHTHTTASDGALSPLELLSRAQEAQISHFAITDHDTIRGWRSVVDTVPDGVNLIPGVELSCVWSKVTIHVVGLGFDPDAEPIVAMLARLDEARQARAEKIAQRLASRNIPGALAGALEVAGGGQIGRPHFARWMVSAGYIGDIKGAFDKYLGQGKIGDVQAFWPTLEEAVQAIIAAGGRAILAHPLKYKLTGMKLRALCQAFVDSGGTTIEVINGKQSVVETKRLHQIATDFGVMVSMGSDFHRDFEHAPRLGVDTLRAGVLPGVWEALT